MTQAAREIQHRHIAEMQKLHGAALARGATATAADYAAFINRLIQTTK